MQPQDDPLPVSEFDAHADAVELDRVATLLAQRPAAHLLAEMEAVLAVLAPSAARSRGSIFVDRLLARDLVRAAHPDPIDARLRLHLQRSQAHATATQAFARELDAALRRADERLDALRSALGGTAPQPASSDESNARLRAEALYVSWQSTRAQIALVRSTAASALEQHRHVRDLLVPLWREGQVARGAGDHAALARGLADLRTAMARLRPIPIEPSSPSRQENPT